MRELEVRAVTLAGAYHKALQALYKYGEVADASDWNTRCLEAAMTIKVDEPLKEPMISKCFIGGPADLQQYVMEMLDGILDFEIEKGNWTYTYHDRMVRPVDQVQFVIDELKRNPDSRRAVIMVRSMADVGSDDPACLQHLQYFIRLGKLDCMVMFRSNDACKASFMNMFALIMLQDQIAASLGLDVGTYTHRANSYHCYEKDMPMLKAYVERIQADKNLCWAKYDGDWKDMMEDEVPAIMDKVEVLRCR